MTTKVENVSQGKKGRGVSTEFETLHTEIGIRVEAIEATLEYILESEATQPKLCAALYGAKLLIKDLNDLLSKEYTLVAV